MLFIAINKDGQTFFLGEFQSIYDAEEHALNDENGSFGMFKTDVEIIGLPTMGVKYHSKVTRSAYSERQQQIWEIRSAKLEREKRAATEAKERNEYDRLKAKFEKS